MTKNSTTVPTAVMVCTRLDESDNTTIVAGLEWAELLGAPLVVCHVVTPLFGALVGLGDTKRVINDYLQRHIGDAARHARIIVADGDPEEAIVQVARRIQPQLVVVGPSPDWAFWPRSHVTERLTPPPKSPRGRRAHGCATAHRTGEAHARRRRPRAGLPPVER